MRREITGSARAEQATIEGEGEGRRMEEEEY